MTGRALHVDNLKTETPVGPTTRAVNIMCNKLGPPPSFDAQITAEPLRLERFKEAMNNLCCLFGHLNLDMTTTECQSSPLYTIGQVRSTALYVSYNNTSMFSSGPCSPNPGISTGSNVMKSSTGQQQHSQCHLRALAHIHQESFLPARLHVHTMGQGPLTSTVIIH